MSYLLGGESVQSRQDTLQDISESSFNQEDEAYKNRLDETLSNALTPARIATRSIANLGIAADAIPTAIGTYYGIDNSWWHKHVTQSLIHTRDALTPDPQTTHVSLQIADQFAGMLGDVAVTLGNPVAFSAMQGGKRVTEELEKGKGLGTSLKLGAVDALAAKAYMTVPLGFASKALPIATRLQGAATGAVIGAGIGSASEMANESVLKADGYPEEAKQHDWSNPTTLALNAAFGAVFGGIHPHVLPSHQDAVLTAMDAHAIENPDSLSATNPASNNALVDGMNQSVRELVDGVPITSSIRFTEKPEIPADLLALAGERMSRGERQSLEQQKADLEYKLKQIEEGDYAQQGMDLANEQQVKIDAENSGKRLSARKLAEQRKTNIETANDLGEGVRLDDAQPHQDSLGRLNEILAKDDIYQSAHAEISRIEQQHLSDNGFIRNPAIELLQKQIDHEISQLNDAYDQINDNPLGKADDPLVMIKPEDMEAVAVARGGWKGIGDIEVKGSGWGLAKFIWKHGEKSAETPGLRVIKEDIIEFPNIIRKYSPSREASKDGSRGREWRVKLPGKKGELRTVVFADNLINGREDRHLVTVHVQQEGRSGHEAPLSIKKAESSDSSSRRLESPLRDTTQGVLAHASQDDAAIINIDQNKTNASKTEPPEITSAREAIPSIESDRQFEIEHDDGTTDKGSASELMARADEEATFAEQSDTATSAAISCFLKFGDL